MRNTLGYYIKLACTTAGVAWDRDNDAEVHDIIDEIDGEFDRLKQRISELESRVSQAFPDIR